MGNVLKSITIITLTYKNLEELSKTLRSVFSQDFCNVSNVQYIIADDGTEGFDGDAVSNSVSSIKGCNSSDVELLVYSNGLNIGTVKSFNKAIEKSTGDIIIPLSCGDEFECANSVKEIVKSFENTNAPIITGYRKIVNDEEVIGIAPSKGLVNLFRPGNESKLLKYISVQGNIISGASTYYSRQFLKKIGGFDEAFRLLEDYPIYLKALNEGYRIEFIEKVLMRHSTGGVSDVSSPANVLLDEDYEILNQWILNNLDLSFFERRLFKFLRLKPKKGRYSIWNISRFPDCFLYWVVKRSASKVLVAEF